MDKLVSEHFNPVRLHVKKHPEAMGRFGANWTPTVMILDAAGNERHRIEGFLPADEFLAQLHLGLGQEAFKNGRYTEAESHFREVVEQLAATDSAPEAQYWAGVSRYKATNDFGALKQTAEAFKQRYADSVWAKKASIWE